MTSEPIDPADLSAIEDRINESCDDGSWQDQECRDREALFDEVKRLAEALAERDRRIAEAWDDGFTAGRGYQARYDDWVNDEDDSAGPVPPANPYRAVLTPDQQVTT